MSEVKKEKNIFVRLFRDAMLCACFIFAVIQGLKMIPVNAEWFQPASNAFSDFDWSDVYFSNIKTLNNSSVQNEHIVVINIDDASRADIAVSLLKINEAKAKAIGLDVLFKGEKDSITDLMLDSAIRGCGKKIVVACYADSTKEDQILSFEPLAIPLLNNEDNIAYINFLGDENLTVRSFYKVQRFKSKIVPSFAFGTFLKFNDKGELSAYKLPSTEDASIIAYQSLPEHYTTFHYRELLDSGFNAHLLENKIVLLGFAGSTSGMNVVDDKHFTPLNPNYAGKALPDMFGVYIHANIIESYINKYHIYQPSRFLQVLVCIVFIFMFLMLYLYSERKDHAWQAVVEITLQIIFAFVLLISAIYFLGNYGMKWDIGEMIAAVALAEPLIGFYKVLILFLSKVYHIKSIFLDED